MEITRARPAWIAIICLAVLCWSCGTGSEKDYELVIRGGTIYDGLGGTPFVADLAISGDRIAAIGDLRSATGEREIDAENLAVSPGFINMLSWAVASLIEDGRGMSDIMQGVTLEVMGEGWSMGPWTDEMKQEASDRQGDIKFDVEWTTLSEYLEYLETRGVSPNVASYVGATTVRIHEVGYEDRKATPEELARMQELVREAMRDGAIGVASALIYAPASFADSEELIALVSAAGEFGGTYISHIRSEGNRLEEGVEELIAIARETGVPAEIYHLKASGRPNWHKLERVFQMVEEARAEGLRITADMYTYPASATGLNASMPLWVQEGGHDAWVARLEDPAVRGRVIEEMNDSNATWENRFVQAGPENILLIEFKTEALKPLIGKTLAEVAAARGTDPAATAIDLVIEDNSRVGVCYFMMSEENVRKKVAQPWVSFGSDEEASATEGIFLESNNHPRAFGTFARVLGKYSREDGVVSLEEAVRRMTSLPADNIGIRDRGRLAKGFFADVVVFDPATVQDHATFEDPHHYSTGVHHVFVNGEQVVADSEHTGATPGRVVRGPGWTGWYENGDKR
ncbi:MAG: D-aminoacylase [Acidobacteria bacterium]|uniref:D-aminoacylase n=1 Tax=Candidatus Sulfomarinibacter kjeldsenii TaxID=2885994 RepID=A0A8J6Y071_9BACT|nr:D-aminoacylase [Candidatus Sulfomarinibacter kjeldsenii]